MSEQLARVDWNRRLLATAIILVVVLAVMPGIALAETRAGGSVVVPEGETIDGDLEAFGGTITVSGTVDGNVRAFGGTVRIDGTVTGDVSAAAGTIVIGPDATIDGTLDGAAGTVTIDGAIGGNVEIGAETITVSNSAVIDGNLEYDGTLERAGGATIGGQVVERSGIGFGPVFGVSFPNWIASAYLFATGLLVAVILLAIFPRFSATVADSVVDDPLRSGGAGLLTLFGGPILLVLLFITIIGIPVALVGIFVYIIAVWIGSLYGRYAVGEYLLSLTDIENRWIAVLTGFVAVAVLIRLPLIGGLVNLIVLLLGLGAIAEVLYRRYRGPRGETRTERDDRSDEESGTGTV